MTAARTGALSLRARLVIAVALAGGACSLGVASRSVLTSASPSARALVVAAVFGALVLLSWLRPLLIFVDEQSKELHLDEGFLIVLLLLVGPAMTVVTFGLASVLAQLAKRRALVKSVFNTGQLLVAVGVGAALFALVGHGAGTPDYLDLLGAVAAAAVFVVINNAAIASILAATGTPWRSALLDGLDVRLKLDGGGVGVALATALVVSAYPWALPVAVVPLLIFRQVLAGHFHARHDRARLSGLLHAALRVHHSIGRDEVTDDFLGAARTLLRCSQATLGEHEAKANALVAKVPLLGDDVWLTVSGRSRTEPFDGADQALLDALAAVGAGALSNAALYEHGRHQKERLVAITSSLGEGVCAINPEGAITFMNPAASAMLGWESFGELEGPTQPVDVDTGPPAPAFVLAPAMRAVASGETVSTYDTPFLRADGSFFDVACTASPITENGVSSGAVLVFRDISERKQLEEQLARHAFHDALTGLPNRRLFLDHLDHALRRAERSGEHHALLFCDIDRFKVVNDSLGHHAGDALLIAIAERISTTLRPGDMLARFGGDEFTVLLDGVADDVEAVASVKRILECLRAPISLPDGHEVVARLSIGIALTTASTSRDDLLHDADVAMYQAKARGRSGGYQLFDVEAMGVRSAERIDLEGALRRAIERGELENYYQPLFSVIDQQIVGVEALVRWNHPERGLLAPEQFIGLAEDTGLILPLGKAVLQHAALKAREWQARFGARLSVAVNLSARQFQDVGLVEEVKAVLDKTEVDPSQLCFEITESLAMENVERTNEVLTRLKELGARVAIDDFGTGYSALGYLASFPIDVVKIDRSFVEGVEVDPVKSAIVSAVITMSKAIGSTTVVEGVETDAQLRHLRFLGCSLIQGHHLARPMPASALERLLDAGTPDEDGVGLPLWNEAAAAALMAVPPPSR